MAFKTKPNLSNSCGMNANDLYTVKTLYKPKNERVKRKYFEYMSEAQGKALSTLNLIRKSLRRFEAYTKYKDFSSFNKEQAIGFKKHLQHTRVYRSGEPLSEATIIATLKCIQEFMKWLACMPGYKSRIHVHDIAYDLAIVYRTERM